MASWVIFPRSFVSDSSSNSVKRRADDADGVSTIDQHTDGVLEEVDTLVEGLLMSIVPDTVLLQISAFVAVLETRKN